MIYFDNAATTKYKPKEVIEAFCYYVSEIGVSPGRGSYGLGINASRMLYQTREKVAKYFGLSEPNVVFTKNSTEAINLFLRGFLKKGDHVVISPYEHNAVLRPLQVLKEEKVIEYSVVLPEDLNLSSEEFVSKYFKDNTVLMLMPLASNLTGRIIFSKERCIAAKSRGVATFIDASQGAGKIRLDMLNDGIDYIAFTGHKDLRGLPGVGGLCSIEELSFAPLIQGGTGVHGHEKTNPKIYPDAYEAGTLNMPAIWALGKAVEYSEREFNRCLDKECELVNYLIVGLQKIPNVIIYDMEYERVSTVGFNVKGYSSNEVVRILDKHGICVRGGIHCAILAHETLGTVDIGVVRVSIGDNNSLEEIDELITIIKAIGDKRCM